MAFRRACFGESPVPRSKAAFDEALDQGRARLHSSLAEITAEALRWFTEARSIRRALDDPGSTRAAEATQESHEHLRRLLNAAALDSMPADWLRQLPRYLKAEERRWQRSAVRGGEPPNMARELARERTQRHLSLAKSGPARSCAGLRSSTNCSTGLRRGTGCRCTRRSSRPWVRCRRRGSKLRAAEIVEAWLTR